MKNAPAPRHEIVRNWGAAILLAGLLAAALIYAFAADDKDREIAAEIASGRMYQHNLELMGGKLGVLMAEFNDWFTSLWHGRRLAYTVAALAVAAAAGCFWVARLMSNGTGPSHQR